MRKSPQQHTLKPMINKPQIETIQIEKREKPACKQKYEHINLRKANTENNKQTAGHKHNNLTDLTHLKIMEINKQHGKNQHKKKLCCADRCALNTNEQVGMCCVS